MSAIFDTSLSESTLIADAGSTKISWVLIQKNQSNLHFSTKGINPSYLDDAAILERLRNDVLPQLKTHKLGSVRFFGAGVLGIHVERMESIFRWQLRCDDVICRSDLDGAAISLFGREDGVACILGTGSNSCIVRNGEISDQIPTLGFVLGDEGSAGWIGKELLRHYFYRLMPQELMQEFKKIVPERSELLGIIKEDAYYNRYIASFASFVAQFPEHPYMKNLIEKGFNEFIEVHILPYGENALKALSVGFVGTVASMHRVTLERLLNRHNLKIGSTLRAPIEALAYHFTHY